MKITLEEDERLSAIEVDIRVRLGNGEDVMVSRKYAPEVKRRLGLA